MDIPQGGRFVWIGVEIQGECPKGREGGSE